MGKINLNSRNNRLSIFGIVDLLNSWVTQPLNQNSNVQLGSLQLTNNLNVGTDLSVGGNLTVTGTTTVISSNVIEIKDNIIEINSGETGTTVTSGSAGLEINRGTGIPYRIVFSESTQDLRTGFVGNLQRVSTIEDSPLDMGFTIYNNSLKILQSTQTMTLDLKLQKSLYFYGTNYNSSISSNAGDSLNISSVSDIFLNSSTKVVIPDGIPLAFDQANDKNIVSSSNLLTLKNSLGDFYINTTGDILLNSNSGLKWGLSRFFFDGSSFYLTTPGNFNVNSKTLFNDNTSSSSLSVASVVFQGGISIQTNQNSNGLLSGGSITTNGGVSIGKDVYIGGKSDIAISDESINHISSKGVNFTSNNRTVTTPNTGDLFFNSFNGGTVSSSSIINNCSTVYIGGAPTIVSGGTLVNTFALLVNSGDTRFGGNLFVNNVYPSKILSNDTTNATSYFNSGSITTPGGCSFGKDLYLGGKIDICSVSDSFNQIIGQGVNFRSRQRNFTPGSLVDITFNSFEGGTIVSSGTFSTASTLYIAGAPNITSGSITTPLAIYINSGDIKTNGSFYSTNGASDSIKTDGGITVNNNTESTISSGTIYTRGGILSSKLIYSLGGINVSKSIGDYIRFNTSTDINRFVFSLKNIETGSNNGSDFVLKRFDDTGILIDEILQITRSTGKTIFNKDFQTNGKFTITDPTNATSVSNGGSFTTSGGGSFLLDLYVGQTIYTGKDFYVTGISNLQKTNINTTNGVLSITGTNGIQALVNSSSYIKTSSGSITVDAQAGSLVLNGNTGISSTTSSGISLNAGASSNFTTSSGTITISGVGVIVNSNSSNLQLSSGLGLTINAADTTNGIKIGTTSIGVPVVIGSSSSETTISNNLTVLGNCTVLGTTTSVNSVSIITADNSILINSSPSGTSDGGFIIRRYQTPNDVGTGGDVILDTPKESGAFSANSSGVDTLTLSVSSNSVNNYYSGWWIKVTSGSGINQVRRISSYNGTTKVATIYSNANTNSNHDGKDLTTPVLTGDTYQLFDSSYVAMFFNESLNQFSFVGLGIDPPTAGQFPSTTSYFPLHIGSLISDSSINVSSGVSTIKDLIIDTTSSNSLLIRKNGNTGNVFNVNSQTSILSFGNPVNTINSTSDINLTGLDSTNQPQTFSNIKNTLTSNTLGNLSNTLTFSVQNNTNGLTGMLSIIGSTGAIELSNKVTKFHIFSTNLDSLTLEGGALINSIADTTSSSTQSSFYTKGGASISLNAAIGGKIIIEQNSSISGNSSINTSGTINSNGDLNFYNSSNSKIFFNGTSLATPQLTTRSSGSRIILNPGITSSTVDYGFGVSTNTMWYSVSNLTDSHSFYVSSTKTVDISNSGINFYTTNSGVIFSNSSSIKDSSSKLLLNSSGYTFKDSSNSNTYLDISSIGTLTFGTNSTSSAVSSGIITNVLPTSFTDSSTATLGTNPIILFNKFSQPTLNASNTTVTTTNSCNFYIEGAVIKGINQTLTNSYGIYVDNANSIISSGVLNKAASVYIKNSPISSGTGSITNSYSLFVENGISSFGGPLLALSGTVASKTTNNFDNTSGSIITSGDLYLSNSSSQSIYFNGVGSGAPSLTTRSSGTKIVLNPQISGSSLDYALGISTNSMWYSVPSISNSHDFYVGTNKKVSFDNTGIITDSSASNSSFLIKSNTIDGTDNKGISICGGGSTGQTRGAQIDLYGNEFTGNLGNLALNSGGSGIITFGTNSIIRLQIANSGELSISSTTDSTGTGTGSLTTPGGLNVDKSFYVGTSLNMNFNQNYSYTGDTSGRLNVQSKTTGIAFQKRFFTNDGNNLLNNLQEIYGLGTPTSLTNTEYLQYGYIQSNTSYYLRTAKTGTGVTRPLILETNGNSNQIKLNTDGSVSLSGNLAVTGTISYAITTPTVVISNPVNITGTVSQFKSKNVSNGIYRQFSIVFTLTPTASGTLTSFDFTLPEVVSNFTTSYDICASINGHNNGSPNIENITIFSVSGTTTCRIVFTSASTTTNVIQSIINYNL